MAKKEIDQSYREKAREVMLDYAMRAGGWNDKAVEEVDLSLDLIDKLYEERFTEILKGISTKDLPEEYAKIINRRFWDLV